MSGKLNFAFPVHVPIFYHPAITSSWVMCNTIR